MVNEKFTRREFLKYGFNQFKDSMREVATAALTPPPEDAPALQLIRPPGALPEEEFLEKCTQCNECVKVCPEEAILKFVGEGKSEHLTPMIAARSKACVLCEDFPCVKVCEPRALIMPASRRDVKIGLAVINEKLCHAFQGMDCDYCVKDCPFPGEAIFLDDERKPRVNEDICTGCGLCENICPSRQSAIVIKTFI